jgi:tetratricopeptide (TPR) repeat protein
MTRDTRVRVAVYSAAALLCGALLYGGFVYKGEPEIGTILNGAEILSKVGAHDQAIVECEKVLERDPGNLQAHLIFACSLDRLGRTAEAIERYRRCLPLIEDRAVLLEVRLSIADLRRRGGDLEAAIRECLELAGELGANGRASLIRGLAHDACGETESAEAALREAIALEPDRALSHYLFGSFLVEQDRHREALEAFEKVRALDAGPRPAFPTAYRIAQARVGLDDRSGALEALDESCRTWRGFTKRNVLEDPAFGPLRGDPAFEALVLDLLVGDSRRS